MHLLFAIAVAKGMTVSFADASNAFQQSPGPTTKRFLEIDEACASWCKKRFGVA